jgi:glyceraldehyde 3-phosphate dehydrogenase
VTVRVGVNGFGRIGRNFWRAVDASDHDIEIVAANDLGDIPTMAHLLKYDSVLGPLKHQVEATDTGIAIDGKELKILAERDPGRCLGRPRGRRGDRVDRLLHQGRRRPQARRPGRRQEGDHLRAGQRRRPHDRARRQRLDVRRVPDGHLQRVLHDQLPRPAGEGPARHVRHRARPDDHRACVHAGPEPAGRPHKDLRRARAAAINVIPTSTGAAKAIGLVLPELQGRMDGYALRVPVPTGSCTDLTVTLSRESSVAEVNAAYAAAADGPLKGYLRYTEDPIVSSDIVTDPASCIFDAGLTKVIGDQAKVVGWYDNEWGYSNRLADLVTLVGSRLS